MVTAYLMRSERLSAAMALASVRRCRPRAYPNEGFQRQLAVLELELRDSSSTRDSICRRALRSPMSRSTGALPQQLVGNHSTRLQHADASNGCSVQVAAWDVVASDRAACNGPPPRHSVSVGRSAAVSPWDDAARGALHRSTPMMPVCNAGSVSSQVQQGNLTASRAWPSEQTLSSGLGPWMRERAGGSSCSGCSASVAPVRGTSPGPWPSEQALGQAGTGPSSGIASLGGSLSVAPTPTAAQVTSARFRSCTGGAYPSAWPSERALGRACPGLSVNAAPIATSVSPTPPMPAATPLQNPKVAPTPPMPAAMPLQRPNAPVQRACSARSARRPSPMRSSSTGSPARVRPNAYRSPSPPNGPGRLVAPPPVHVGMNVQRVASARWYAG